MGSVGVVCGRLAAVLLCMTGDGRSRSGCIAGMLHLKVSYRRSSALAPFRRVHLLLCGSVCVCASISVIIRCGTRWGCGSAQDGSWTQRVRSAPAVSLRRRRSLVLWRLKHRNDQGRYQLPSSVFGRRGNRRWDGVGDAGSAASGDCAGSGAGAWVSQGRPRQPNARHRIQRRGSSSASVLSTTAPGVRDQPSCCFRSIDPTSAAGDHRSPRDKVSCNGVEG